MLSEVSAQNRITFLKCVQREGLKVQYATELMFKLNQFIMQMKQQVS